MRRFQLHLITDAKTGEDLSRMVAEALAGGVDYVQLRQKGGPARALYDSALHLSSLATEHGAKLLVNDRIDVALASGADGAHLAAKSLPPAAARRVLGDDLLLGCSVHGLEAAREAADAGADYVTFGHVYPTASKPGLPPRGVRQLAEIVESVEVPVLAIGGIEESNLQEVLATGAAGVSVISTIASAPDPRRAARRLREALDGSSCRPRRVFPDRVPPQRATKGAR